jgi:hypothetical protein
LRRSAPTSGSSFGRPSVGERSCKHGDRRGRLRLAWLVGQHVLRRDEDKHLEKASRHDIALHQFSLGVLLLLLEDIPFFAIQLMLIRTNQAQVESILFLNMLKTSGMLATK